MTLKIIVVLLALLNEVLCQDEHLFPDPCESLIYCKGDLLDTIPISLLSMFDDGKAYVDFSLQHEPEQVLQNFYDLGIKGNVSDNATAVWMLEQFVLSNFENSTEVDKTWKPPDWKPNPSFLENIADSEYKVWALELHNRWESLGREIKEEAHGSNRTSLMYVSSPFIVPGGRFSEFFYWDTYWIQKGLLVSQMNETVRGMLSNFVEMINSPLGYIPNGGRIYFLRTQPPLFIPMVKNYVDATGDIGFVEENIRAMEKEFEFFMKNRTVTFEMDGKQYTMARYNVERKGPRPEGYRKDVELRSSLNLNETEEALMFSNLKSACESGWDFSSRWFVLGDNETMESANLSHTKTRDIIPVDLNGFLYLNAIILGEFCGLESVICNQNASDYLKIADEMKTAIRNVLWDEELGSWFDYDYVRKGLRKMYYATNIVPLWVQAHHDQTAVPKIMAYFAKSGAFRWPGGIPTSMFWTGQQWDFPNAWAPLNHIVVEALHNSGSEMAKELAFELAEKWTRTNFRAYVINDDANRQNYMYEKYDVTCLGCPGGGGLYKNVIGFGWTNGVILDFLHVYGDRMIARPQKPSTESTSKASETSTERETWTTEGNFAINLRSSISTIIISFHFIIAIIYSI